MKINKDQEEQIVNFGVFNYDQKRIAAILDIPEAEVASEMQNQNSLLSKLLEKGRYMADYVIDLKLFELAKVGDLKALEKLETRQRKRNY